MAILIPVDEHALDGIYTYILIVIEDEESSIIALNIREIQTIT